MYASSALKTLFTGFWTWKTLRVINYRKVKKMLLEIGGRETLIHVVAETLATLGPAVIKKVENMPAALGDFQARC